MIFIEKALYTTLDNDATISSLASGVYNSLAPEDVTFPFVVFQKMGGWHVPDNPKENIEAVYVVKAVADDLMDAENLDLAIKNALDRQSIGVNTEGMTDYAVWRQMNLHFIEDVGSGKVVYHVGALYDVKVAANQS